VPKFDHSAVASTFDAWASQGKAAGMQREHGDVVQQVLARIGIKPGERCLELGCGNGWATRLLAQSAPGASAIGVDVSPEMIARAEALHSNTIRARYELCAFEQLGFKDAFFDRAFSMEALYYAIDLDQALREVARVLKPGAPFDAAIDHYRESPRTQSWSKIVGLPLQWLGEAQWRAAFERAGFTELKTERVRDRRGPGTESEFRPSAHAPDWAAQLELHACGSLWISARKG
jgi:arsenite methyltransferase